MTLTFCNIAVLSVTVIDISYASFASKCESAPNTDWRVENNKCYHYHSTAKNFADAEAQCLATVKGLGSGELINAEDKPLMQTLISAWSLSGDMWVGHRQTSTAVEPAGNWFWYSGVNKPHETITGTRWQSGEPNGGGGSDCGVMVTGSANLWDRGCSSSYQFGCEYPEPCIGASPNSNVTCVGITCSYRGLGNTQGVDYIIENSDVYAHNHHVCLEMCSNDAQCAAMTYFTNNQTCRKHWSPQTWASCVTTVTNTNAWFFYLEH